ncbi:MAG: hypothetical protein QM820_10735 [Minicystis sp.]
MSKKPRRVDEEPPYTRYAFLNPYNLSLLVGAGAAAAATGQWWVGVCGAAGEALWLLFAPESKFLRKNWFDKMWSEARADAIRKAQEEKLALLHPADQQRVAYLRDQKERIHQLARENPSLTADLMRSELIKLDRLIDDFINIAVKCTRAERHLESFDSKSMENAWRTYRGQVDSMPEGDKRRAVAKKNMEVLEQRRNRWDELRKSVQTARGQMELMENTFKLLGDEIVTMSTPDALGARLDDLRIAVEAIRETTAEGQELQELYEEEALAEDEDARMRR